MTKKPPEVLDKSFNVEHFKTIIIEFCLTVRSVVKYSALQIH